MHRRLTRLLIAFALALTIPVQGLAAMTAGLCMAMGHHDAGISAPHDHATDHSHDQNHSDDSSDQAHCAPCVACCAAAHIAPATEVFIAAASPAAAIAAPPFASPGFLPDQLDRPPLGL